jgi:glyoxylase-like metal-dependent hydrolase (beta-lactamase superfamily II)
MDGTQVISTPQEGLRCVLAPNASPMTHWGTNTFLVGEGEVAVIDPGPAMPGHQARILEALAPGERISHIFVTHSHLDHSPLARALSESTGAPVLAFGDSLAGKSEVMQRLAAQGLTGGGEGVDPDFAPDVLIADGEEVSHGDWSLRAMWTPGHFGNHLCFEWGDAVFTGDLVMGWASSLVSPPDGDLSDFMASCARLKAVDARIHYPAHGAPIHDPAARLDWLIAHRRKREEDVLLALSQAAEQSLAALTARVYADIDARMWPIAERNCFAHLIDLVGKKRVTARPELSVDALFSLSG